MDKSPSTLRTLPMGKRTKIKYKRIVQIERHARAF